MKLYLPSPRKILQYEIDVIVYISTSDMKLFLVKASFHVLPPCRQER